jgi:hypothetical protein
MFALSLPPACTQFPELDDSLSPDARAAAYPTLVPLERIRAFGSSPRLEEGSDETMAARIAALRMRAARLQGSVLDSPSRARLQAGVTPL